MKKCNRVFKYPADLISKDVAVREHNYRDITDSAKIDRIDRKRRIVRIFAGTTAFTIFAFMSALVTYALYYNPPAEISHWTDSRFHKMFLCYLVFWPVFYGLVYYSEDI